MHHPVALLPLLLALLLAMPAAAQGAPVSFDQSVHAGEVTGTGSLAALDLFDLQAGSGEIVFERARYERGWANDTVQVEGVSGGPEAHVVVDELSAGSVRLSTNSDSAILSLLVQDAAQWSLSDVSGDLTPVPKGKTHADDRAPLAHDGSILRADVQGSSVWRSSPAGEATVTGTFWVSLYGWDLTFGDGSSFSSGSTVRELPGPLFLEDIRVAWLKVEDATLTLQVPEGTTRDTYLHDASITTVGTTRLQGPLLGSDGVFQGTTTLQVTSSSDHLEALVTEGPATGARPSATAVALPEGSVWLWGGLGAVVFVAAFVFVALTARSTPMLEWRSYHALDRHRPRLAAFWANLWTRRDPWDGHAWSARGEARMMMHHDRGAARDFTKAHALLPPEERAVNALHAARSHARVGHATQTAHWIGIVASHDINVLLTAREEPDFARVWDHASVQRAVQQVLGVGV